MKEIIILLLYCGVVSLRRHYFFEKYLKIILTIKKNI